MRGSITQECPPRSPRQPIEPPSASRQLEILRGKLQELQADVGFLRARTEALEGLRQVVQRLRTDFSSFRAQLVELEARVDTLRTCRGEDNELVEELRNQSNALWSRVQALEKREEEREAARPKPSSSPSFRAAEPGN